MISERMDKLIKSALSEARYEGKLGIRSDSGVYQNLIDAIAELEAQTQWKSVEGVDPATLKYPVAMAGKNALYSVAEDASEWPMNISFRATHFLPLPEFKPTKDWLYD